MALYVGEAVAVPGGGGPQDPGGPVEDGGGLGPGEGGVGGEDPGGGALEDAQGAAGQDGGVLGVGEGVGVRRDPLCLEKIGDGLPGLLLQQGDEYLGGLLPGDGLGVPLPLWQRTSRVYRDHLSLLWVPTSFVPPAHTRVSA